jgi:hypothetical protein
MSHFYFCIPRLLLESCIPVIFICTPLLLLKYYRVVIQYHTNCNNSYLLAFLCCCNLIWGLANNYSLYFLQFWTIWQFTFVLYFHSLLYCTPIYTNADGSVYVHFNEFWTAIFAYMNIFDMRTMILCQRNEKK